MPKHKIYIKSSEFNPVDDSTRYHWFNACGESKWAGLYKSQELRDGGFKPDIIPSDLDKIYDKLKMYIDANDAVNFRRLIRTNFIYNGAYPSCPTWATRRYESREVRPIVEALFFERNDLFHNLIKQLIHKNTFAFYVAFCECLEGTDLSQKKLFCWDKETRDKALKYVTEIEAYSQTCQSDDNEIARRKGREMQVIAKTLRPHLFDREYDHGRMNYRDKFQTLSFKLGVISQLQGKSDFGEHRGYKRIIVNFMTLFFLGGIPNLINKCATGNWLFFNKTESEQRLSNFRGALGIDSQEKIKFNTM